MQSPCNTKCYLCTGTDFNKRPGSVRNKPDLEVLECASCGLVFLSSFGHIKDGFYENSGMGGVDGGPSDPQIRLKHSAWDNERRFQFLKSILPNRSLLDFGCGAGGFLLKARELTAIAHGVEPEGKLKNQYKSLTVFQNVTEVRHYFHPRSYDIITLFHVVEHLGDPKSVLRELSKLIVDDGQIIIETPNADDALLTLYQCEAFQNHTYWDCHLFLYTAKTLRILFDQVNLKVNYIKQIQRYPLSNHLYWLATGISYGHKKWHFLDSPEVHAGYEKQLAAIGKCDTLMASVSIGGINASR